MIVRNAWILALLLLLPPAAAFAATVPEAAWQAMKDRMVAVELNDGGVVEGQLIGVDGESVVVLRADGRLATLSKAEVATLRGLVGAAAEPAPAAAPPPASPPPPAAAPPASAPPPAPAAPLPAADRANAQRKAELLASAKRSRRSGKIIGGVGAGVALAGVGFMVPGLVLVLNDWNGNDYIRIQGIPFLVLFGACYGSGMGMMGAARPHMKRADRDEAEAAKLASGRPPQPPPPAPRLFVSAGPGGAGLLVAAAW